MRPLQRIVWSEGMLMSSQHFQQQDLYHETLLDERILSVTPYAWGAVGIDFDERALDAGQVTLRSFAGVLPRGSVVRVEPGEPEAPASRAIEGHFPPQKAALDVYLGLPLERVGAIGYARTEASRGRARYVIETRNVLDAVSPSEEESVDFARRNMVLLFGDEAREDFESIKLAEITRQGTGKLVFAEPYVAPSLRVLSSKFLMEGFRRVLGMAVARHRAVAEERRHRDASSVEYAADDVTRYLALHALSGVIPVLKHAAETGDMSPYQAYLLLVQLAGQLTAFTTQEDPSLLPSYLHGDPRQTFEPLFAKLTALLRIAVSGKVINIPFEARADGMHLARLQDEKLSKAGVRFVLSVQAGLSDQQMHELIPRVAKVASWSEIPRLVTSATSGVPLLAAPRPPREIPVRAGRCYFAVGNDHPGFRAILHERAMAVHLPPPFDPKSTVVELLAIPAE